MSIASTGVGSNRPPADEDNNKDRAAEEPGLAVARSKG